MAVAVAVAVEVEVVPGRRASCSTECLLWLFVLSARWAVGEGVMSWREVVSMSSEED